MEELGQGFGNAVTALCVSAFTIESAIEDNKPLKECYLGAREHARTTMGSLKQKFPDYVDVLDSINRGGTILCNVENTPDLDSLLTRLAIREHTYAIILVQSQENSLDNTRWDRVIGVIGYDGEIPNYTFVDSSQGCAFKFTDLDFEARKYLMGFTGATFTLIRIQVQPKKEEEEKKEVIVATKKRQRKEEEVPAPVKTETKEEENISPPEEEKEEKAVVEEKKKKPKVVRKRATPKKKTKE